jgi:hypothetical protein
MLDDSTAIRFYGLRASTIPAMRRMVVKTAQHMAFQNVFTLETGRETKWRLIIDLRPLNKYCKEHKLIYETHKHLKSLTRTGDCVVSFGLTAGYYTLGIREEDKNLLTVKLKLKLKLFTTCTG